MSFTPLLPTPGVPDDLIRALNERFRQVDPSGYGKGIVTTRQLRDSQHPTSKYAEGTFLVEESARGFLLYQLRRDAWTLVSGNLSGTLSQRTIGLGRNDAGILYDSTSDGLLYRWTGSAWTSVSEDVDLVPSDMPEYVSVSLLGQTGNIGATNMQPGGIMAPAGLYEVGAYIWVSVAGVAGPLAINVGHNDGTAGRTSTTSVDQGGTNRSLLGAYIWTAGAANITYAISGITAGTTYNLKIAMQRVLI